MRHAQVLQRRGGVLGYGEANVLVCSGGPLSESNKQYAGVKGPGERDLDYASS
jgi:hypothetical protein